jgi:hypothetical protein
MNLATYKLLNEDEQFEIIERRGIFLAEREDSYYNIRLYQVDGFYAEIFCHSHFNVIVRTRCFSNTKFLDVYLDKISLDGLTGI